MLHLRLHPLTAVEKGWADEGKRSTRKGEEHEVVRNEKKFYLDVHCEGMNTWPIR
jgi:hypothetical protein